MKFAASLLAAAGLATFALAETPVLIAEVDFDGGQTAGSGPIVYDASTLDPTTETVNPPSGTITFDGIFNQPGTVFDGPSSQLGWRTFYNGFGRDSPAGSSSTDTQEIGVTAGVGVGGSQGFKISDTDDEGEVVIRFDEFDPGTFRNVWVTFDIFVADTSYEDDDFIAFTLEQVGVVGSGGESLIEGSNSLEFGLADEPGFVNVRLDFNPFPFDNDGGFFEFGAVLSADSEFVVIDNVQVFGVPSPGAAALFGFAGLAAVRRRR